MADSSIMAVSNAGILTNNNITLNTIKGIRHD